MSEELEAKVGMFSPFQRSYCEYRARGLSQSLAAAKAGSTAEDKQSRGRVGYQIEQIDGAKDYIAFLQAKRAETAVIDDITVINMLKKVFDAAFDNNKFKDANVSAQLIGMAIGLFNKPQSIKPTQADKALGNKNNTEAFKEEEEELNRTDEKMAQLTQMLKDLNK